MYFLSIKKTECIFTNVLKIVFFFLVKKIGLRFSSCVHGNQQHCMKRENPLNLSPSFCLLHTHVQHRIHEYQVELVTCKSSLKSIVSGTDIPQRRVNGKD